MFCYTIGHSNHSLDKFRQLLAINDVNYVLDIRSVPYSSYVRHFNHQYLDLHLEQSGIGYRWLGRELGGRIFNPDTIIEAQQEIEAGLDTVLRTVRAGYRVVLMCTEKEPLNCHRLLALTPALKLRGLDVQHIMADGTIAFHAELERELIQSCYGGYCQLSMFEPLPSQEVIIENAYRHQRKVLYTQSSRAV